MTHMVVDAELTAARWITNSVEKGDISAING
jgi:hypothetical protein